VILTHYFSDYQFLLDKTEIVLYNYTTQIDFTQEIILAPFLKKSIFMASVEIGEAQEI